MIPNTHQWLNYHEIVHGVNEKSEDVIGYIYQNSGQPEFRYIIRVNGNIVVADQWRYFDTCMLSMRTAFRKYLTLN